MCQCHLFAHTCLLSLAAFPFCTPQTKVAPCAAEPTFTPPVKPQGQPHVCKSGLALWNLCLHQCTIPLPFPANSLIFPLAWYCDILLKLNPIVASSSPSTAQYFLNSTSCWSCVRCINVSAAPCPYYLYHWVYVHVWNYLWCLLFIDHRCQKGWCEIAQPVSTLKVKCRLKIYLASASTSALELAGKGDPTRALHLNQIQTLIYAL